ncbi:arsenic metallochaperone ArsD family protein [Listeria booriae]|uniref:arsenic metallochaperone ArsD family protein n=1 Tax=Listeria booriae TaxID=1552123 RepID=UPI0016261240|nr:arsenic metallochaperone ArsD family protein [Listeria booriae]MBC2164770.1 arsenic metallochaperone ArsD family protein [Listeria booriae]
MIELTFFLNSRESLKQFDEVELQIFNSFFDKEFLDSYFFVMEEQIVVHTFYMEDSLEPFLKNDGVMTLLKKDGSKALPIILKGEEIIKSKNLLNADEYGEIFDMGVSIQYSDD